MFLTFPPPPISGLSSPLHPLPSTSSKLFAHSLFLSSLAFCSEPLLSQKAAFLPVLAITQPLEEQEGGSEGCRVN